MNADALELPEGWAIVPLSEIVLPVSNIKPQDEPKRLFQYVDISSIDNCRFVITEPKTIVGGDAPSRARRPIQPGDVLFSNVRTYLRNIALVTENVSVDICSTGFTVLRPSGAVLPSYVFRYVLTRHFIDLVTPEQTGTHYPATSDRVVLSQSIPLPPLAEQRRIVAAAEIILEKVSTARERLERMPITLKRFRQAILASACTGRLTEEWRRARGIPGSIEADEDGLEYPPSWACKRTAELVQPGTVISYGIVLPGPNQTEGVPYVRGMDIDDSGRIQVAQLWRTTPEIAAKHKRSELKEGDVLLCVIRNLRVAVVPPGLDGANLTQGTVRIRPSSEITAEYLAYYLASPQAQAWMKERYVGTDMPRINVEHARSIPVPVPSLEEQVEICRRVSGLLELADSAERRSQYALRRVESLSQAVLAKAFSGGLVPTEAELARRENRSYESASELLARHKASLNGDARRPRAKTSKRPTTSDENLLEFMEG